MIARLVGEINSHISFIEKQIKGTDPFQWHILAVLGNHDYTGNALAQQDPAIREVGNRYLSIAKSFIVNSGTFSKRNLLMIMALFGSGRILARTLPGKRISHA